MHYAFLPALPLLPVAHTQISSQHQAPNRLSAKSKVRTIKQRLSQLKPTMWMKHHEIIEGHYHSVDLR